MEVLARMALAQPIHSGMCLGILAAATVVSHGLRFELEMRLAIVPVIYAVIVLLASALYVESKCVLKSN